MTNATQTAPAANNKPSANVSGADGKNKTRTDAAKHDKSGMPDQTNKANPGAEADAAAKSEPAVTAKA